MFFQMGFSQSVDENRLPIRESQVTLPVKIPLSEVAKIANSSVKDLIYEDKSYEDNGQDLLKLKIWKSAPIKLTGGIHQNILIEIPIKVWASKGIQKFGLTTYQETSFETVMFFDAQILLQTNWKIKTNTQAKGFRWVSKPELDFGIVKIPITSLVEKYLKAEQEKFCSQMDDILAKNLDFQHYAVMAWNSFQKPFYINEQYNAWLKITPTKVSTTPLEFYNDQIHTTIGIQCFSETFLGKQPADSPPLKIAPDFTWASPISNQFTLKTHLNIPLQEVNKMANEILNGKIFELDKGKIVKITSITTYHENGKLLIETETEGAVNGISILTGIPIYDALQKKVILSETKYRLKTKNILHKAGVLLFQNKITQKIEKEFGIPTAELEEQSQKSIEQSFNTEYFKGLKLSGKVLKLSPGNIAVHPEYLTAEIDTQAEILLIFQDFAP